MPPLTIRHPVNCQPSERHRQHRRENRHQNTQRLAPTRAATPRRPAIDDIFLIANLGETGRSAALNSPDFRRQPKMFISEIELSKKSLVPGEAIGFQFDLTAECDERLMIDDLIEFVKANGETSEKVFEIKHLGLAKCETWTIAQLCDILRQMTFPVSE